MIEFSKAQSKLKDFCKKWSEQKEQQAQNVSIYDSLNCCLAEAIYAQVDLPHDNMSAMDGYALRFHSDANIALEGQSFPLVGESKAGTPFTPKLNKGSCVRIMTGAVVPSSAQTVVMQENTVIRDGRVVLLKNIECSKNIRYRGEEISEEQLLFLPGTRITPSIISVLASQGISHISIQRPLKIGFFSSGDELRSAGEELSSGTIYESNLHAINALLKPLPVELHNLGIIADSQADIEACLKNSSEQFDILISSGGVSVGDYDYIRECVTKLGNIEHYKIAIKPGKPVCFGQIYNSQKNSCLFFGLPGNPVSAFVTLQEFFIPTIWELTGCKTPPQKLRLSATLKNSVRKREGRMEFQRGLLSTAYDKAGNISWRVKSLKQDSHRIYNLSQANCYIILPQESGNVPTGNTVTVEPFPWCFNA